MTAKPLQICFDREGGPHNRLEARSQTRVDAFLLLQIKPRWARPEATPTTRGAVSNRYSQNRTVFRFERLLRLTRTE